MRKIGMRLAPALAIAALCAPAVAQVAPLAPVETTALARDAFSTGLISRSEGGLDEDLWQGADPRALASLLDAAPMRPAGPSIGIALRRTLLSSGSAPVTGSTALGGAKLNALARLGFVDEARTIESLSSAPAGDPAIDEAMAVGDLLSGDVTAACQRNARLTRGRDAAFWVKLRILCYAAANELDAAELALGLLREQGALSDIDEAVLTPLAAGGAPKAPVSPIGPIHLAALKMMQTPVTAAQLSAAEAGVVKYVAKDGDADWATRLTAGAQAAAMGVMSEAELKALYAATPLEMTAVSGAIEAAAQRPGDVMTDAALYQSVLSMTAPEFLRDKAVRIATAIDIADTMPRAFAAAVLYADDIAALNGAIVEPRAAHAFARARMAVGDSEGARRWLMAMQSGGLGAMSDDESMAFIDSVALLSVLDRSAAQTVADAANVEIATPRMNGASQASADRDVLAVVVDAAIDAATDRVKGQAALAAIAASDAAASGDPVAKVVMSRGFDAAGLTALAQRRAFEEAWSGGFAQAREAVIETPDSSASNADEPRGFTPRLKPKRGQ